MTETETKLVTKRSDPLNVFRFRVEFTVDPLDSAGEAAGEVPLCSAAFSECSGLEATMEPKVIKEGGRNYGPAQRVGPVSFGTVVLKRGIGTDRHLWQWFNLVSEGGSYAYRLQAKITLLDDTGAKDVLVWTLRRALPVKFKSPDLSAKATDVGIEELHIVFEELKVEVAQKETK